MNIFHAIEPKSHSYIFLFQLADWWLNTAYLEYRSPVVVFSSPGLVWPKQEFRNVDDQIRYAANLIAAALDYNQIVEE